MGVCAFAPFGWRLHGGGAFFLLAGGLPAAVPWVGWRGLRDARFKPEAVAGEAFFLEVGVSLAGGFLRAGGCMEGASFLRAGGRAGRCQEAGGGLPGSALPEGFVPIGCRNGGGVLPSGRCRIGAAHRPVRCRGAFVHRAKVVVSGRPRCRMSLAGIGPARSCPSGRRPQRGCSFGWKGGGRRRVGPRGWMGRAWR